MKLGAQLYTLRNACKTTEGLEETLKRVSDMGYSAVQLSGVCEYDPAWMRDTLRKYNLTAPLTHINPALVKDETDKVIADHKTFGCPYIGIGGMPTHYRNCKEEVMQFIVDFKPAAQAIKAAGCKLCYHNHAFEFRKFDGKIILDYIIEQFDADLLNFTLDTYWVQAGGGDPARWIQTLSGRVDCIHFKDMAHDGKAAVYAPIYEGNMNFDAIVAASKEAGVSYAFVELDDCYGADPFESMKISYDNVVSRYPALA